jgi:hypothetical protein
MIFNIYNQFGETAYYGNISGKEIPIVSLVNDEMIKNSVKASTDGRILKYNTN